MNRPRFHKVLHDLYGNWARSLLVVASIAVGLLSVGIIVILRIIITDDMVTGYRSVNPAVIQVNSLVPFKDDLVKHIARAPGVAQVEGMRIFASRLQTAPDTWTAIDMHTAPDFDQRQVSRRIPIAGKWPPGDKEIVIEQFKLPETHAALGDFVTIETAQGELRRLRLVGVVTDQTVGAFNRGPGFFLAPVQGYITPATAEWLGEPLPYRYNTLYLTIPDSPAGAADNENNIRATAYRVRDEMEKINVPISHIEINGRSNHPNRPYMEALTGILFLLGFLAVFLSGFLITNTLQAIVQQQIQQIGILKTLGARKSQIVVLYMALILMFGLAGALIAIPLAQQISFQRLGQLTASVNVHYRGARLVPQAILIQAFLAIIVPQVAALFPILQGAQLSVSEALIGIRQSGKSRRSRFDQHITRLKLFSLSTLLSIRNTFRRTGRLALTLVTLSLGGAIFIATFNIQASMDEQVKLVSRYFLADVNITLTSPRRILEVQRLLGDVPGVGYVEGWAAGRGEMVLPDNSAGPPIQLLGPPANTRLVEPQVLKGRWVQPGDVYAIALNERFLLDYPQYQVGGVIPLRINGKDRLWTIVGFFQLAGKNSSLIGYTHYDSLSAASGQLGQAFTYRVVADQPDLSADAQRALGIAIEKRLKAAGVHAADLTTGNFIAGNAAQGFSILNGFLLFLATLTAIVGSIGLAGSMSLNVMERTREIGVLRAIGATNRILARLVISEGVLVGGMSWVIAALAAIPISKVLSDSVSYAIFGNPTTLQLTPTGFLLWLGAVLLLSILAGVIPARSAAQLTIREVLAYE